MKIYKWNGYKIREKRNGDVNALGIVDFWNCNIFNGEIGCCTRGSEETAKRFLSLPENEKRNYNKKSAR